MWYKEDGSGQSVGADSIGVFSFSGRLRIVCETFVRVRGRALSGVKRRLWRQKERHGGCMDIN